MTSKSLLRPEIQKIIEFKGWKLRDLQNRTIKSIINGDNDIIISAPTASGKTEAALFPAISNTYDDIHKAVKILYISPLIALINDQYERLCKLNESDSVQINITKWHSEVSYNRKNLFLTNKSHGILIITPESLESFLVNKKAPHIFRDIEYYIIDEFHNFLGEIRGDQLKSILSRIDKIAVKRPRRVLLSATLNGDESCKKWLNKPDIEYILHEEKREEPIRSVQYFEGEDTEKYYEKLGKATTKKKSLVFGNSKSWLESISYRFKELIKDDQTVEVHHGSLNKKIREEVEGKLKKTNNISVFCTNTLELGIDIGNIDQVSLLEPSFSVASFIQRIGRSGRGEGSKINFNLFPTMISSIDTFPELRTKLIRSLALVDLTEEGWVEPKEFQTYTYSIFAHQMLAILAQNYPADTSIHTLYMGLQNFHEKVSENDYKEILNYLIEAKYLCQKQEGFISLDTKGERLTKSYDFYSVFSTEEEWNLLNSETNEHLGTISRKQVLKEEDVLLFAGDTWKVLEVHDRSDKIKLAITKSKEIKLPLFTSGGGSIHKKVHQKMLSIYSDNRLYNFLNKEGNEALQKARKEYKEFIQSNRKFTPIFRGSQVTDLISFILNRERKEHTSIRPCGIGIYSEIIDQSDLNSLLTEKYSNRSDIENLIQNQPREALYLEKYDYLLPDSILKKSYIDHRFGFNDYLEYLDTCKKIEKRSA